MSEGKFFFIRSKLNELVLDVKDAVAAPGQPLIMWDYSGADNQIFYEDPVNDVIRSKLDDNFVIDFTGGETLELNEFNKHESSQKFKMVGDQIQSVDDPSLVFDIQGSDDEPGANVLLFEAHGGDNQLWEFNYLPPYDCFVRSLHNGKVIDIMKRDDSPGAKIVMYKKKEDDSSNQLFYEDKYGMIHARLNDFVIDTTEGKARMQPYDADIPGRQWIKLGSRIANREDPTQTLQIKDPDKLTILKECRLEGGDYTGESHQMWTFDYL